MIALREADTCDNVYHSQLLARKSVIMLESVSRFVEVLRQLLV